MPDPDHLTRLHAGLGENPRDGVLERPQVVLGVLQRPVGLQPNVIVRLRQAFVDDTVCVRVRRGGELAPVRAVDEDGAPRLGAEVERRPRMRRPSRGSSLRLDDHLQRAPLAQAGERLGPLRQLIPLAHECAQLDATLLGEVDCTRQVARFHPAAQ